MIVQLLASLTAIAAPFDCDVTAHGAVAGDGRLDTVAFQKAIDNCAPRGERITVPAGQFDIGTIILRSGTRLHLAPGAKIVGSRSLSDYPLLERQVDDQPPVQFRALIFAPSVDGVSIDGEGTIDGQGDAFWDPDFYASGLARPTTERPYPWLIFTDCRNVRIGAITLTNSPSYHLRLERCRGVDVDGLRIAHDFRSPNTDGINMADSSEIRIRNCRISTGDDAIAITSGRRDVSDLVEHCALESDDAAVKIGPRTGMTVSNIRVRNIAVTRTRYGIAMFMADGGRIEDVRFSDFTIDTGSRHSRDYPIFVDIDRRGTEDPLGVIDGVTFERIAISTDGNVLIGGQPDAPIRNITLRDIVFSGRDPVDLAAHAGKPRGNVTFGQGARTMDYSAVSADFVAAHVHGLHIENLVNDERSGRPTFGLIDTSKEQGDGR